MCVYVNVHMYVYVYVCACARAYVGPAVFNLLVFREGLQPLQQGTRDVRVQVLSDGGSVVWCLGWYGEALIGVLRRRARRVALRAIGGGGACCCGVAQRRAGAGGRRGAGRVGGRRVGDRRLQWIRK